MKHYIKIMMKIKKFYKKIPEVVESKAYEKSTILTTKYIP
jgi:hypothetical protein